MTEAEMQTQIQSAQDTVNALCDQRNAALNEVAKLLAQIAGLQRKVTALEGKLQVASEPMLPLTNGHDADVRAVN